MNARLGGWSSRARQGGQTLTTLLRPNIAYGDVDAADGVVWADWWRRGVVAPIAPTPPHSTVNVSVTTDGADYVASRTTAVATGAADPTRRIVALVLDRDGNRVTSATFGGVAATIHQSSALTDGVLEVFSIISAPIPNGSGNQNCTLNFADWGSGGFWVVYFVITGIQATPIIFAGGRASVTATAALSNIQAGDLILAHAVKYGGEIPTSFAPSTEPFPNANNSLQKPNFNAIYAWKQSTAATNPFNVRANTNDLVAAIAFRPLAAAAKQFLVGAMPRSQRYLGALGTGRYVGKDYASEWAG